MATDSDAALTDVALGAPLAQAHAPNDYEHDGPLLDALEHGFTSVEADVWLVDGEVKDRAVEAVISGNRPLAEMQAARTRYSFYDGRSTDLRSGLRPEFMPLVSENWTKLYTWQGVGQMPAAEREALHDYVEQAHATGYRVRFWATNDIAGSARENLWSELQEAGVDHINTDDLPGLQEFLTR